ASGAYTHPRGLAFDSAGNPGITYHNLKSGKNSLYYSFYNGSWNKTQVVRSNGSECGKFASLVYAGTTPHIAYYCNETDTGWWHAWYVGGRNGTGCYSNDWSCEFVQDASSNYGATIAIGSGGTATDIGLAFNDSSDLGYAVYLGSGTGGGSCPDNSDWNCSGNRVFAGGTWPALIFDGSDNPNIAFYDVPSGFLGLAQYVGGGSGNCSANADWNCVSVHNDVWGGSATYPAISMDFETDGDLAIAFKAADQQVALAVENGNYATSCSNSNFACTEFGVYGYPSMILTDNGPYLTFTDGTDLLIAFETNFDSTDCNGNDYFDCEIADDSTSTLNNGSSIAYYNDHSTDAYLGILYHDASSTDAYYRQAPTIDVRIAEIAYRLSNPDEEWIEFYIRKGGNLNGVTIGTYDTDDATPYSFAAEEVDTGEFLVLYMGHDVTGKCDLADYYCWDKTTNILNDVGDDVRVEVNGECHDYVAYGQLSGGEIDNPVDECEWDGTYPAQPAGNPNPETDRLGVSIASLGSNGETWLDGFDGDATSSWEESGVDGGPPTFGSVSQLLVNGSEPTPVQLHGAWASPAAQGGMLIEWAPANQIETMALRPMRKMRGLRRLPKKANLKTHRVWEPVGSWQLSSPDVFDDVQWMKVHDPTGTLEDKYAIEAIDSRGDRRLLPQKAKMGPAPKFEQEEQCQESGGNKTLQLMSGTQQVPGPNDACRVEVMAPGWVTIGKDALVAGCPQMEQWSDISVSRRGKLVARKWTGQVLEFQAMVATSRFEQGEVYMLLPEKGLEIATADCSPEILQPEFSELFQVVHLEEQQRYNISSPQNDHFYWQIFGMDQVAKVQIEVAGEMGTLRVHTVGMTDGEHRTEVWSGGKKIGEGEYEGRTNFTLEISAEGLQQVGKTLSLEIKATGGDGDSDKDAQYLDWIELEQATPLRTGADFKINRDFFGTLVFPVGKGLAAAYDVTNPDEPLLLQNTNRVKEPQSDLIRVSFEGIEEDRILRLVTPDDVQIQTEISPSRQIDWPDLADYLVIAEARLVPELEPLLSHRRAKGLTTAVVEMDAIRDSVGHGFNEPAAIREFLKELTKRWGKGPRFLLLAGAATVDPRDYLGAGENNGVPSELIKRSHWEYEAPADDALLPEELVGKVAIGRLPVRDAQALGRWIQKLSKYEGVMFGQGLVLGDGSQLQQFKAMMQAMVKKVPKDSWLQTKSQILGHRYSSLRDLLLVSPKRLDLLTYTGHSQPGTWGTYLNLGQVHALPDVIWTLGAGLDCYDGHFAQPKDETLAWELLHTEGRGALAVYAPSTVGAPPETMAIGEELFAALSRSEETTVGEAILLVEEGMRKRGESFTDVPAVFNFIGDPAMTWHGSRSPEDIDETAPGQDDKPGCACQMGSQNYISPLFALGILLLVLGLRRRRRV
ncbi:MAG: C25 family cysteine peptidase, partial [Pseudomonadota bacterium]